jgi:hypothetical protein
VVLIPVFAYNEIIGGGLDVVFMDTNALSSWNALVATFPLAYEKEIVEV